MKQEYKDDISLEDALGLALRVMSKTMDSTTLSSEKRESGLPISVHRRVLELKRGRTVEFAKLTLNPLNSQPRAKIYRPADIDALLSKLGLAKKEEDAEMKPSTTSS